MLAQERVPKRLPEGLQPGTPGDLLALIVMPLDGKEHARALRDNLDRTKNERNPIHIKDFLVHQISGLWPHPAQMHTSRSATLICTIRPGWFGAPDSYSAFLPAIACK